MHNDDFMQNEELAAANLTAINGAVFTKMLRGGAERLNAYRKQVNDLNVFPIPDGDTGDNMLMTFGSGYKAASSAEQSLSGVCLAAKRGMLLGARGNSGVILSRIFAGITDKLSNKNEAFTQDIIIAMRAGVASAYGAVPTPVEGTILTVFKDAVDFAESQRPSDAFSYFDLIVEELQRSLKRTPELLPVLAEAGVVDSGGAGLTYIFMGMRDALYESARSGGENSSEIAATDADFNAADNEILSARAEVLHNFAQKNAPDLSLFTEDSELTFGYCTEFLLRLQNAKTDVENFNVNALIEYLNTLGDSIVAFKEGSIVKVHVHTKTPGNVLNFCQQYGEFLTLKIENMTIQNDEAVARGDNAQASLAKKQTENGELNLTFKAKKKTGIVAVASGEGLKNTFLSLGVDEVIDGGQSMNPSAQSFIKAFENVSASRIFVFPNNKNVVLAAKQAAELYKNGEVTVIETHTLGEGYAAISMLDVEAETADVIAEAKQNIQSVKTLLVSKANKNTEMCGVKIISGEYIAFINNEILSCEKTPESALLSALEKLDLSDFGVMLLFRGESANISAATELSKTVSEKYAFLELFFNDGNQPVYDYLAVLE